MSEDKANEVEKYNEVSESAEDMKIGHCGPQRPDPLPPKSINNRLIVEPYKKEGLKTTVSNGFAMVTQKVALKGLKVLMRTEIILNGSYTYLNPGDVVYVKEEILHTQQWAQKVYQADAVEGDFMVIDATHVDFVVNK